MTTATATANSWQRGAHLLSEKMGKLTPWLKGGVALGAVITTAFAAQAGYQMASAKSYFAINELKVIGGDRVSAHEVKQIIGPVAGQNLLEQSLPALGEKIETHPWIKSVTIRRELPGRLVVSLMERMPVALAVVNGQPWVIDDEGVVIEPASGGLAALPKITGLPLPPGPLSPGDIINLLALRPAFRAMSELAGFRLFGSAPLSRIDIGRPGRVTLYFAGSDTAVIAPATPWSDERSRLMTIDYLLRAKGAKVESVNLLFPDKVIVTSGEEASEAKGA